MLINKAPAAAPIVLNSAVLQIFLAASGGNKPCLLALPASSKLDMTLLSVTATGFIQANQPGTIEVGIFAHANAPDADPPDTNTGNWVLLGSSPAEPIGGATDLVKTSWMIQGTDLMFNLSSGKMQGTFKSNVADTPIPAEDLATNPINLRGDCSPVMWFAVGAMFTPTADDGHKPDLEMVNFILTGDL